MGVGSANGRGGVDRSRYESTTLSKAFAIINALSHARSSQSLDDVCQSTSLNKTTVFRLLSAMMSQGYVSYGVGGYGLGYRLLKVAQRTSDVHVLRRIAHPFLERLAEELGLGAYLGFERDFEVEIADRVVRGLHLPDVKIGSRLAAHATALGKVLLGRHPDDSLRGRWRFASLARLTPQTITDPEVLLAAIAAARSSGEARAEGEFALGLNCAAASIVDETGVPICAIAICASDGDVVDDRADALLRQAANDIRGQLNIE